MASVVASGPGGGRRADLGRLKASLAEIERARASPKC
jgi:hypothetical protein